MTDFAPSRPRSLRRFARRWWWLAYALLLAASIVVQAVRSRAPAPSPPLGQQSVELPAMTRDGPVAGRSMRVTYLEWDGVPDPGTPPVILLHGSPGKARDFSALGPALADRGYRVIAVDLPGFGGSTPWVPSYSNRAHAHALLAFLDALGITEAHVVGWSNGGGVGIDLADIAPDRIATLTLMAATAAQRTEGSGNYWFEHAKYALGYAGLVVLPELVPHFGLLADRADRHAFIRSFWDTDLRPHERIMRRLEMPTLVLHGRRDFLIADWAAVEHDRMMRRSSLVMLDSNHFIPFFQAEEGAGHLDEFFRKVASQGDAFRPYEIDLAPVHGLRGVRALIEGLLDDVRRIPWWIMIALVAAISRRRALTTAICGLLVASLAMDFGVATAGLWAGLFLHPRRRRDIQRTGVLPWIRALVAVPLQLLAAQFLCSTVLNPVADALGWVGLVTGVCAIALLLHLLWRLPTRRGRQRLRAEWTRAIRHEFWPSWIFYVPLVPWLAWLSLRHGHPLVWTCVNPGIESGGGVVGESKHRILQGLASSPAANGAVLHAELIEPKPDAGERARLTRSVIERDARLGGLPAILKPDSAQRGFAVRLARSHGDIDEYFGEMTRAAIVQRYHAGPMECGILWARNAGAGPDDACQGRIFSITRKQFPELRGDGVRSVEDLIWAHPRYRAQAPVFLSRFRDELSRIPAPGERIRLGVAGNHCQGTLFADGSDLITPELEARIDQIASGFGAGPESSGALDFGRFDVRYESDEALRRADGFGIVELNGAMSESTNLYDPTRPLWWSYAILFRQWSSLYELGSMRRRLGARPMSVRTLLRTLRSHYRHRPGSSISD